MEISRIAENVRLGGWQSGQLHLTVNQAAQPSVVQIHHLPPKKQGDVAQLVEHTPDKGEVTGSIPVVTTM